MKCRIEYCHHHIRNRERRLCNAHYTRFLRYGDPIHYPDSGLTYNQMKKINDETENWRQKSKPFPKDEGEYTPFKTDA